MKKQLLTVLSITALGLSANAQITITAADMPVNGDTLRWSSANPATANINTANTGANTTWDFSLLSPIVQGVDQYKLAAQVNIAYAITIAPTAYGYKIGDNLPGLPAQLPITASNLYTFFNKKSNPSRYVAEGFAAEINSIPVPAAYSDEDEVYIFPLTFGNAQTNNTFKVKANIPSLGSFSQQGTRRTDVDGWGTIKTPYATTPVAVIRVRSEITEIDSIQFAGQTIGLPRETVEYTWLANGEHFPILQVTATKTGSTETVNNVRYRDTKRSLAVKTIATNSALKVFPIPATGGQLNISIPFGVTGFTTELFDASGKLVASGANNKTIDITNITSGQYMLRVISGSDRWYQKVERL